MLLGFDFGMKYIGVASGQLITKTATPLTCLQASDGIPDWDELAKLINTWQPEALIVGIPVNMDGTDIIDGAQITACAKKFAKRLHHKYKLPVHEVDERLSSWQAKQQVGNKDFAKINATAAAIILEQWLNS